MDWLVLVFSGLMEASWAVALDHSDGFSQVGPTIIFILCLILSMAGLGYASKTLPMGVAYAVWVGIGIVGTAAYGMLFQGDPVNPLKLLFLAGMVGCIAGLKVVSA